MNVFMAGSWGLNQHCFLSALSQRENVIFHVGLKVNLNSRTSLFKGAERKHKMTGFQKTFTIKRFLPSQLCLNDRKLNWTESIRISSLFWIIRLRVYCHKCFPCFVKILKELLSLSKEKSSYICRRVLFFYGPHQGKAAEILALEIIWKRGGRLKQ